MPWRDYETLKKMQILESDNKDNVRVIQRCLDYLKGERQMPTMYQWNLMKDIYMRYYGEEN